MRNRTRKSSTRVTLVLLGAAALAGCSDTGPADQRDVYASKEDCLADWRDPKECEKGQAQDSRDGRRSYWYGPTYATGASGAGYRGGAPRPGSRALGTHSTARGGFGGSGHAHGASAS